MKVVGIIAEYNPFHRGHAYMLRQCVERLGDDAGVVCVMSGNFVQRGEPAIFEKYARARCAVACGADLVLELPLEWALASAPDFAAGATRILAATGLVTHLCFGSENGSMETLEAAAETLLRPEMDTYIKDALKGGVSYAQARQDAFVRLGGEPELVREPNNILALEYLRCLKKSGSAMACMTVTRTGAGHDQNGEGALRSASEVRSILLAGGNVRALVPEETYDVLLEEMRAGRGPVSVSALEQPLLALLRMLPRARFCELKGATEGLDDRLYRAVHEQPDLEHILAAAKTRRYAMSRLRRMLLLAALCPQGEAGGQVPYLRVLALSQRGRELLKIMKQSATLPVLIRPASVNDLSEQARECFKRETAADDLYALAFSDADDRTPGRDWRMSPYVGGNAADCGVS